MEENYKDYDQEGLKFLSTNGRPIPGESLTNSPDTPYPWEQATQFTELEPAIDALFIELTEPEAYHSIINLIDNKVPLGDIAQIVLTDGFQKGMWNPDLLMLLIEPTMYMIMALAEKAEIEYVLETGDEDEPIIRDPDESIRFINEKTLSLDKLRKESALKINSQSIPKEIKEQVEKIELAPSLLEKLEIEKQNDSLLSRGEQ